MDAGAGQAGRECLRAGKDLAQGLLAATDPLGEDFRAGDDFQMRAAFHRHGAGQQRLAGAGGAGEEDAAGLRGGAEGGEVGGMVQGEFDHLAHGGDGGVLAADVRIAGGRQGACRGRGRGVCRFPPEGFVSSRSSPDTQAGVGLTML